MAVIGVIRDAVDYMLDPDGIALPRGAIAASPTIGRGYHVKALPPAGVALAEDEVDPAMLRAPCVHKALLHYNAAVAEGEGQEAVADRLVGGQTTNGGVRAASGQWARSYSEAE